jgi:MinD-like ATPase involved in chromosome partitioning or flagellar assembly
MAATKVAIVGRDPEQRLAAVRAFDDAPAEWNIAIFESAPASADVLVGCPDSADRVDIRFDPGRPAQVIEDVAQFLSRSTAGRVIGVTSASGGVGVTSIALHLAAAYRPLDSCYLATDPDPGVTARLNLPKDRPTWGEVKDAESLMSAAVPIAPGFRALLAPAQPSSEQLKKVVVLCRSAYDRVVIDISSQKSWFSDSSDRCVVVATPTRPSMHRTRLWLRRQQLHSIALIANRLGPGSELTRSRLQAVAGTRIIMELPCTPALRDREDEGKLLLSAWYRYWRRIRTLARAL